MSNSCVIVVGQLQNTTMAVWLPFVVSSEWQHLPLGGAEHHHLGVGGEPQHLPPLGGAKHQCLGMGGEKHHHSSGKAEHCCTGLGRSWSC